MLNVEAINKTIAAIENAHATRSIMGSYSTYARGETCGTAHCIGGWVVVANGLPHDMWEGRARYALGLIPLEAEELFGLQSHDIKTDNDIRTELARLIGSCVDGPMSAFDTLTHSMRKDIMLDVLETLRDTGKVDWLGSLKKF